MGFLSTLKNGFLNTITLGGYSLGKKIGNTSEAIEQAAIEASIALASIGVTVQEVGEQLESILSETEKLIVIKRLLPRDVDDLWDDEKERLEELETELERIENKMKSLGIDDPSNYTFGSALFDFSDISKLQEKLELIIGRYRVKKEIYDILYSEPGIISDAIYNVNECVERFNTLEQPRLENIMDCVEDNLEKTEEILEEVKKLFVVNKKEAEVKETIPWYDYQLEKFKNDKLHYLELLEKKEIQIEKFDEIINPSVITSISDEVTNEYVGADVGNIHVDIHEAESATTIDPIDEQIEGKIDNVVINTAVLGNVAVKSKTVAAVPSTLKYEKVTSLGKEFSMENNLFKMNNHASRVKSSLNSKDNYIQRNKVLLKAQKDYLEREYYRIDKIIELNKIKNENEPGIVPKTLDEVYEILKGVRTEEQPRIDTLLDSLNETLIESKETMSEVKDAVKPISGIVESFEKIKKLLLIGVACLGGLIVLDLLAALIVLIKIAIWG